MQTAVCKVNDVRRRGLTPGAQEVMQLFDKFNGCIKSTAKLDCREEMNAYLDERYGV